MRYLAKAENFTRGSFSFPIALYHVDRAHPRYEMPFHWHLEQELILVREGTFPLLVDGQSLLLQSGDAVFLNGGQVHGGTPHDSVYECAVFDWSRLLPTPISIEGRLLFQTEMNGRAGLIKQGSPEALLVAAFFKALAGEEKGYEFASIGLLLQLFGLLIQDASIDAVDPPSQEAMKRSEQIKDVLNYIRKNYMEAISLEELAAETGLDAKYFCRVFRQATGKTPIEYANYYRIECAAEILCTTPRRVTDVAIECGFHDLSYFNRVFRNQKNQTPSSYRQERRNDASHKGTL